MMHLTRSSAGKSLARSFSTGRSFDVLIVGGGAAGINVAAQLAKKGGISVGVVEPSAVHHNEEAWAEAAVGKTDARPTYITDKVNGMVTPPVIDNQASEAFKRIEPRALYALYEEVGENDTPPVRQAKFQKWEQNEYPKLISSPRQPIAGLDTKQVVADAGAELIADAATGFEPEKNQVVTKSGNITYKQLIVATGTDYNMDSIKGLKEGLADKDSGVLCWTDPSHCLSVSQQLHAFDGGKFVLTKPKMDYVPAEILTKELYDWLVYDGMRDVQYKYFTAENRPTKGELFGQGITDVSNADLVEIRPSSKEAVFSFIDGSRKGQTLVEKYDLLLATPRQDPVPAVKSSSLADGDGFVDVDMATMQSTKHKNVWSLGGASNLPTVKDTVSIMYQSPVLVENVCAALNGGQPTAQYDGGYWYGSDRPVLGGPKEYGELLQGATLSTNTPVEVVPSGLSSLFTAYEGLWKMIEAPFPQSTVGHAKH